MKHYIQAFVLLFALAVFFLTSSASAQIFSTLYNFTNGTDGAYPQGGLILSGSTLYGTASGGGTNISGTAFAVGAGGAGFATLYTFSLDATNPPGTNYTNCVSGTDPQCVLVLSGGFLYGTGYSGGTNGSGTVFAMNPYSPGFNTLHTFGVVSNVFTGVNTTNYAPAETTNADGSFPCPGLVLSGNTLYGTTEFGGTNGNGTVFAVNTDGTGFTTLYTFTVTATNAVGIYTNGDGANPAAGLALCGNTLYGTAEYGGTNGSGTVFSINTDGTGFTPLYNFSATVPTVVIQGSYTNNVCTNGDGAYPMGGLVADGNQLYGTAAYGGLNGRGTLFALNPNNTGFVTLHNFSAENYDTAIGKLTNGDGVCPQATLALTGNTLFGTAYAGGTNDCGTVFSLNTNGMCFTTIYTFSPLHYNSSTVTITNADGAYPYGSVALWSSNMLYGTTAAGGTGGAGTVYAIVYGPGAIPLNYLLSGRNLIVSWDAPMLVLQSAPTVNGPWTTVSGATSPYAVPSINGMQFYQLVNVTIP